MRWIQRKTLILMFSVIFLITASAAPIFAQEEEEGQKPDLRAEDVVYDFVVLRTTGFAMTTLGTVFWIVTSPFTVWGGNWGKTAKVLIEEPGRYTFCRPLGAIDAPYPYEDD